LRIAKLVGCRGSASVGSNNLASLARRSSFCATGAGSLSLSIITGRASPGANGRNAFPFYDSSMDNHLEAKRDLERAVRNALARGEFEVHYQPIVDVRSERTCGYEALLRWRHREKGLLPPSEFIGIAEERLHRIRSANGYCARRATTRPIGRLICVWPSISRRRNAPPRSLKQ
jgi:hypothetical protein